MTTLAASSSSTRYRDEYDEAFVERLDDIIDWDSRTRSEGDSLLRHLRKANARKVLDVACGTGFHAVQLSQAGFDVVANDGAPAMVARARHNFLKRGLAIPAFVHDWHELDDLPGTPFDAVLCLGNSFSHLTEAEERRNVLARFFAVLQPGGLLLLDHRNYEALTNGPERRGERRQRYCCCAPDTTVRLEPMSDGRVRIHYRYRGEIVQVIETWPLSRKQVRQCMSEVGFEDIATYGDQGTEVRGIADSEFWIHVARRPPERR